MIRRMHHAHVDWPDPVQRVLDTLMVMPLASASALAKPLGIWEEEVHPPLNLLEEAGWVSSYVLGSCMRAAKPARRWILTPGALAALGQDDRTWHEPGNLCRLLETLPALDWFYRVAGSLEGLGPLTDFRFAEGFAMDFIATFEASWVALYWSGPQETERDVRRRMDRLGEDVEAAGGGYMANWPCMMVWVASDEWQRQVIMDAAPDWAADRLSISCVSDGTQAGAVALQADRGRGGLRQHVRVRGDGGFPLERRIPKSIWGHPNSPAACRILNLVAEFPGADTRMAQVEEGEGPDGKAAGKVLRLLATLKLVHREKAGRTYRYHLTRRGMDVWGRWHRHGTVRDYEGRVLADSWVTRPDRRRHHEGALGLITQFMAAGLPVAAGWRGARYMGRRSVVPDGLVRLNAAPYLADWFYLEYELSARSPARIRKKLRGFQHPAMDNPALLVVCHSAKAEAIFHQVGMEMGIRMLTATVERLRDHGALGNWDCWSMYGERVSIA